MTSPEEMLNWYDVGGCVRDSLRGKEPSDIDRVVIGHSVEDMINAGFEKHVGESFPVFLHPETKDEWALGRTEVSTGNRHKDVEVTKVGEDVSLEEDLKRRDLTINAMARDPKTGEIIDPHGGKEDMKNKTLRHVSEESFAEDPLRILRLAMFAARLEGFTVHPDTIELAKREKSRLSTLDNMRVYRNLLKMFRKAEEPRRYFDVLNKVDALEEIFPEVARLTTVPAGPEYAHKEGSAFEHTMRVISEANRLDPNNVRVLLAALAHDLGKGITPNAELPSHPNHTVNGVKVIEEWVERMKMEKQENDMSAIKLEHRGIMEDAAKNHMNMHRFDEMRPSTIIRFVDTHTSGNKKKLSMNELLTLSIADSLGRVPRSTPEFSVINKKLSLTEKVLTEITGSKIIEQFDIDPQEEGHKISDIMLQERVEMFKERSKN